MSIDLVPALELSAEDIDAWTRLQGQGPLSGPFLSPHWIQSVARAGGPDATRAKVAVVRNGAEAKAFVPARVGRVTAMPVGAPLCDHQGVVAAADAEIDCRGLLHALGVQLLDFTGLILEGPGFSQCVRGRASSYVIDLRGGYDAYAADRQAAGTDVLKDCAKKRRKLEREQGEVVFTAGSRSTGDFDQLLTWKRAQYAETGQTDILACDWPTNLLRSLFAGENPALRGVLFTLHAGGRLAAAHFALCTPNIAHAWFIAHDDGLQRYSPGMVLLSEVVRWAAQQGMSEVDLGPGDYRFKISLANVQRPIGHGFVGRFAPAAVIRGAQYELRRAAEALPLGRFSSLPGKAMRRLDVWRGLGPATRQG